MRDLGVRVSCAKRVEEFERLHGNLNNYEGLILHLGLNDLAAQHLEKIQEKYPQIPIVLVSPSESEYDQE